MLIKFALICGALTFLWFVLTKKASHRRDTLPTHPVDDLRRCAFCGLLNPEKDCVRVDDEFFCNDEHALAHATGKKT